MRILRPLVASGMALALAASPASAYPIAQERELGERFDLEAVGSLPVVQEPEVLLYASRLGHKLVEGLDAPQPFDYRFRVVRDSSLNAFAVPGGSIWLNTGLLMAAGNDAEIAGVIGHEIGHVHAHHIVRQQEKSSLLSYGALAGMLLSVIQPAAGLAALGAATSVQLKYQREFEQEADFLGVKILRRSPYDPRGLLAFMKRIGVEQRASPVDIPPYMLSHPMSDQRVAHLQGSLRDVPEKPGWDEPSWELRRVWAILSATSSEVERVRSRYRARADGSPKERALWGLVLLHQGDPQKALEVFDEVVAEPEAPDVAVDRARALVRLGRPKDALQGLEASVETNPGDRIALALLGEARLRAEDWERAVEALEAALEGGPVWSGLERDLGQAYGRGGDPALGFFHLARAYELDGDLERAVAQYEKAVERLPEGTRHREEAASKVETLGKVLGERVLRRRPG